MKKILTLVLCVCAALALAGTAGAAVSFGVTEDAAIGAPDGGLAFFAALNDIGLTENHVVVSWDPSAPLTIPNQPNLDAWVQQAALHGIRIVFSVVPAHPTDLTSSAAAPAQFAAFLRVLAQAYPTVRDFVVGNEPNQPRFWQPQFGAGGTGVSGGAYEKVLALGYDALKSVDPSINVIGVGLSPRGNDDPKAPDNISISPVRFLHDLGVAYRASGRTKPLMDEFAFHPYPNQNNDPPGLGYPWPKAGFPNLDRIKQAIWDAFNGTPQPVFAERGNAGGAHPLKLDLDETGWQVVIPPAYKALYYGTESAGLKLIDEQTQAQYYGDIVRLVSCDPNVRSLSFFHLMDERNLDRWQSGLERADGSHRPSYDAVKSAIAQTHGTCALPPIGWMHMTTVSGAAVKFGWLAPRRARATNWGFAAAVQEDATYRAGVFRIPGRRLPSKKRAALARALANASVRPAVGAHGTAKAYLSQTVKFPRKRVRAGWYVYAIRFAAAMNPSRASVFVSRPFHVVGRAKRRK